MTQYLLLIVFLFPMIGVLSARFLLAPLVAIFAAAIALLAGLYLPAEIGLELPWILMGMELGLSTTDKWFLAAAGLLWMAASIYAAFSMAEDLHRHRFWLFFLLAMSGNFTLIVGQDLMTFYLGFTVMGLASYGLVVHSNSEAAHYAGKIYLIMTLLAEFALFAAFVLLQGSASQALTLAMQLLLVLAFGIKAGLFGLHMWLPLAHPAAPIPASAVLSGAMIKAALIGWMRFLPLGEDVLLVPGVLLLMLGCAGVLFASFIGVLQTQTKTVLAYSSIAKMGLMSAALGVAALEPHMAPEIAFAVTVFALHHGLVKAALFFTVGIERTANKIWLWLCIVPIASMLGLPYTSGSAAKNFLKAAVETSGGYSTTIFQFAIPIALIGSVLLMTRFMTLLLKEVVNDRPTLHPNLMPWLVLIVSSVLLAFWLGPAYFSITDIIVIAQTGVVYCLVGTRVSLARRVQVPAGDVLILFQGLAHHLERLRDSICDRLGSVSLSPFDMLQRDRSFSMVASRFSSAGFAALLWFFALLILLLLQNKSLF